MPNQKTDNKGFASENADEQEDIAAKGGPGVGLGNPDAKHPVIHPYDSDTQTQIAAKAAEKAGSADNNRSENK